MMAHTLQQRDAGKGCDLWTLCTVGGVPQCVSHLEGFSVRATAALPANMALVAVRIASDDDAAHRQHSSSLLLAAVALL